MKKKILVSLAAFGLLLGGLVGCNKEAEEPAEESAPASTRVRSSRTTTSVDTGPDWTVVVPHTWADGTAATNSDNKEYIPLTDAAAGKVGVKIAITNYTVESDAADGTELTSEGKINPVNDKSGILTYKIVAPKAGAYQMVLRGKSKSDAVEKTLSERSFTVKLNGTEVDVQGSRAPLGTDQTDFVGAPTINLTGNEDTIKITCCDYRIQFDVSGFIIFAEH